MADRDCFGWTLGSPENVPRGWKTCIARKEQRERDPIQSFGLKYLQKANLSKKWKHRKFDYLGDVHNSARTQEPRRKSNFHSLEVQMAKPSGSSTIRKVFWSRFFSDSQLVEPDFQHQKRLNGYLEPQLSKVTASSEPSTRAGRKRKNSRTLENTENGVERRIKFAENRRLSNDRILDSLHDLEAKLINMSTKNGNLILLAWSLNEEFQMIEKNVASLMEDMKSLHQDLKDLRFANDLLHLLKGELNQVSLKRWPFMILNENFCENPQQEFNLIV